MVTVAVSLAAGFGALLRYVVDMTVEHRTRTPFPLGTLLVNVIGSFALGVVVGLEMHHGFGERPALVVGTGFCGGFTTMSTWAWESLALTLERAPGLALLNVAASFGLCLAAAAAGLGVALI